MSSLPHKRKVYSSTAHASPPPPPAPPPPPRGGAPSEPEEQGGGEAGSGQGADGRPIADALDEHAGRHQPERQAVDRERPHAHDPAAEPLARGGGAGRGD